MDENLFQLVTVGLIGVTLLVLLVTLLTLNKLTKKVEEASPSGSRGPYEAEAPTGAPPGQVALAPTDESATPEPAAATPEVATQASPSSATAGGQQPEPVVEQKEPETTARADEFTPAERTGTAVQEPQPAATGFEDAPEEQPFERDGRWWFKRGDELLVYDEQSGQWEAAPANATATSPAPMASGGDTGGDQTAASPAATESAKAAEDPGSFWKCTSCGAVNGSTATSCRMCFAPKP